MRFVVYGAGAIGGVVGGRLAEAGHEVVLIARGEHHDAIRDDGLRLVVPDAEPLTLSIPVVSHPAGLDFRDDDVVLMAMKSQHTGKALERAARPARRRRSSVVCVQNGVANEPAALRLFDDVYGVCVVLPALHLEPGVVEALRDTRHRHPRRRSLPARRRTAGREDRRRVRVGHLRVGAARRHHAVEVREAAQQPRQRGRSALRSRPRGARRAPAGVDRGRGRARRRRHRRGDAARRTPPAAATASSGVATPPARVPAGRRGRAWPGGPGRSRPTTSTARSCCSGRLHDVPTPVNLLLQQLAASAAREGRRPGTLPIAELIQMLPPDE